MRGVVLALGLVLAAPLAAQVPGDSALAAAGARARAAWQARDFPALVAGAPRLQLQLPGADPSPAVGQAQAVALLTAYVRGTVELGVEVVSARQVGPDRGFVELRRRFRPEGTQEERTELVLIGYRRAGGAGAWRLTELRATPAD
ncbi:MAG TPA: hypothetical protein VFS28_00240 [Gemmatimonadales bacterium]|nr:hypothetical protein [Gemmatimonadales bacterium]